MTSNNDASLANATTRAATTRFTVADAEVIYRNVSEAHAVCCVVAHANDGLIDGAVQFDDSAASRWEPSIDIACGRLREVGRVLCERGGAPDCNWWTSLNLLEALGASMWHCAGAGNARLDHVELQSFLRVAIASLDALLQECDAMNAAVLPDAGRVDH